IQVCATTLADFTLADPQVRAHGTRDLVPGMVLARNLTANNGMLLLNAACWIFPDLASEHGLGFALPATGVAGDLGVVARDMPLWQALGGILLS
uniref:hypothetical protein n=1 Tax=Salmonella sp. SAL4457 TaxID=3159912 RepID=UPI00397D23F3